MDGMEQEDDDEADAAAAGFAAGGAGGGQGQGQQVTVELTEEEEAAVQNVRWRFLAALERVGIVNVAKLRLGRYLVNLFFYYARDCIK